MLDYLFWVFIFWVGWFIGTLDFEQRLIKECQELHNINKCEVIALPVKD